MKKVIIIGAGIAGLSAGVYAQKCGFDVTVLENHTPAVPKSGVRLQRGIISY